MPFWSGTTKGGNINAKYKTTQAEQNGFKNLLGIGKVELLRKAKVFKKALALIK